MGYIKQLTQPNGVTGEYWKVYSVDLLRPDSQEVAVTLANYADKATADANPQAVLSFQQVTLQGLDYPDLSIEVSNLYAKIYDAINNLTVTEIPDQPSNVNTYFSDAVSDVSTTPVETTLETATIVQ